MTSQLWFNGVLLDISNQLSRDQLEQLTFLARDQVGKREREAVSSGFKLFQLLAERDLLSPGHTDYLEGLLRQIHRDDLARNLHSLPGQEEPQQPGEEPGVEPGEEKDKLDAATDVIVENLGMQWRKLGRKLGLSEVKLQSIASRHPSDLEETARELLMEWRRSGGGAQPPRAEQLLVALRGCQFNMMADKLEDKLAELREG